MSDRREPIRIECDGRGEVVLRDRDRMREAVKALNMALALPAATWEPHDWSDFE